MALFRGSCLYDVDRLRANVIDVKSYVLTDMPEEELMLSNEEWMAKRV